MAYKDELRYRLQQKVGGGDTEEDKDASLRKRLDSYKSKTASYQSTLKKDENTAPAEKTPVPASPVAQKNKVIRDTSKRGTTNSKRVQLGTLEERRENPSKLEAFFTGTGKQLMGSQGSTVGTLMSATDNMPLGIRKQGVSKDDARLKDVISAAGVKNPGKQVTSWADKKLQAGNEDIEYVKEGMNGVGKFAVDVANQGLLMGADALVSAIAPGLGQVSFATRAGGMGAYEARQEGASEEQQALYGAATGLMELGLERLFSAGKYLKGMYGQGALDMATPMASRVATSNLVKGIVKSPQGQELVYQLTKAGFAMNEEGIEEALADLISPLLKRAVYADEIDMPSMGEVMYDYLIGAASGGLFGAAGTVADYKSGVGRMNQMQENGTMAEDMINRAAVQGEKTSAGQFAQQLSAQRDSGKEVLGGQLNDLQRMTAPEQLKHETELMRQKEEADRKRMAGDVSKFNRTGTERENRAIVEISSGFVKDKVSDVEKIVAENADLSVTLSGDSATFEAVAKVATGTATAEDIDRILMKPAAKALVKEYTGVSLPVENTAARKSLENLVVFTGAEHRTEILTKAKARVAEDMASSLGARGSAKFTEMYPNVNEQDNEKFYTVFKRFYNAGEYSMPIETVSKLVDDMGGEYQEVVSRYFTPEVRTAIHKAGFADSKVETANNEESVIRHKNLAQRTKKSTFEDRSTPGKLTKPMKRALTSLAKRTGVNIVFVDTLGESNGIYDNGTIYLAADADNPIITVAKHELTHYLKQYAPKEYQELEDYVFTELNGKTNVEKKIEQKIRQYAEKGHHLTRSAAKEEILADMAEAFFTDESAIDRVIAYSKELGEAILDGIRSILDTFLAIADADENKRSREYGRVLDEIGILRDAERLWMKALQASMKNDVVGKNGKVMDSLKDSEGNKLSKAQQEYFAESKIRDEDGNLRVVYHGSAENFTVFDRTKGRANMDIQGMFFSPWEDDAMGYGENVQAYYLNIKNPAPEFVGYKALRKFQGQNNAGVKARDYLESLGYDGVNNGDEEFIAFHSNQIKLISNQKPTKNDDVRYSLKEEDWLKEEGWLDDEDIWDDILADDYVLEEVVEEAPKKKGPRYKEEKNKNGKVAKFTQERIDALIRDSGAGTDSKYARKYITSIHPRDFLSLTLEDEVFEQWDNAADAGTDNRMYKLDVDKLKNNEQTPYLRIDEKTGRVEGHEGRHRMRALLEAGVTSVPIAIEDLNTKYTKKYHSYMVLNAQDFGDGPVNDDAHAVVLDLLPVNEANRTDIELWYGGKGDIKFSVKEDAETEKIGTYIENGTIKHQFKGELQAAPRPVVNQKGVQDKLENKEVSLRELRNGWFKRNGMENQIEPTNAMMDQLMDYYENKALQRYKYIGLEDVVDAKIKYRTDENGKPTSVVISAMVKNAEYPINFDFTSVCKKRIAMQRVIEHLVSENGENDVLYNEFDLSPEHVHEINEVLASYGFETACPICFVESRRYFNQEYADKAISIWNGILEKYEPDAEYFNFAEADTEEFDYNEINEAFRAFNNTEKASTAYPSKVEALFKAHPFFRKKLSVSDLLSTKGTEAMLAVKEEGADGMGLLGIIKGSRGASVAKEVTAFTAYNGEIGMLNDTIGKGKNARTMRDYLMEIGGVRCQSFSDFLIANTFDYIQMISDLAARIFPAHAYSKEIMFAKLFGLTGMKINLSAVCDVDPNVPDEYAGLKQNERGEWVYNIGEQSIDMDEAIKLVNTEGYSRNVGIIMVGMSDKHIWKMLDDHNIGYIIPYHESGLPGIIKQASHLGKADDYTDVQGTMKLVAIKDGKNKIEYDFDAKHKELGSWRAVMEAFNAEVEENGWTVETKKAKGGTGDFDTYEALMKMGPREVADAYIGECLTNGMMPIFYKFAGHENYYKMGLFDYSVVDLVTGETTIQGEVKNIYPGIDITKGETDASKLIEMIDQEMSRMNEFNEVQEGKYADAIAEIKENLSKHMRDAETSAPKLQLKEGPSYDRRVETLEERVAYLKSEMKKTGLKTPVEKDTKVQASKLLKKYDSNMVLHTKLVDTMKDIFKIYKTADGDWYEAYDKAEKMARRIVDKIAILHDEKWQEYKELREYLKKTPIAISEADKQVMGHYGDFYKANRGRMKLVNGAKSNVSDYYSKLVERWPEKFTDDYTDFIDQLHHIEDVLDSLAPWYEHYSSRQMQGLVTEIAEDIMVTTGELATRKTFADRKAEEKERAVDRVKRQRDAAMERMKERYDEKLIRQQKTSKEKMDAYKEKQKDKASRKKAMDRIQKNFDWLRERLLNPSDVSHIPEGYRAAVAELLDGFDFETDRTDAYEAKNGASKKVIRLRAFKDRFRQIMESPEGEAIELDPDFMAYMDEITDQIDGRRLSELDNVTLENVGLLLKQIKHQMSYINKCFNDEISEGIHELGESTIWEANEQKEAKEYTSVKMHVNKLLNESMVTPADMFELIGGAQKKLYQGMRNGFDRHVQNVQMAIQFTQSTIGDAKVKDWSQNKHTFTLESGKVEMTTSQLMSLYALMQRPQAQGHILGSGIVMAPIELKVGKLKAKQKMAETHVMPTLEEVLEMVGVLTDEQKRIADEMRGFLSNECSEWGNRTSMKLYGYKKFTEKDYFPIKSSDSFLNENFDQKNVETSLKSMGFTKAVVREASNPIVIDDFFTVFTDHVNKMSMYEALVPAMTDFQRVYNYKQKADGKQVDSVQKALKRAYGTSATSYIKQFMEDLNGSQRTRNDAGIATSMISTYKKASIGGNLRVLLQQPTSLVRAFAVINPKYFSNTPATKKDIAEMKEHCSIAQWKSYGFYNTDVARDMKDIMMGESNLVDDVFMGTYGKADDWTWANIWKAVKKEVEAKNPNLKKGSDEYWQKVNERASYVYDRTQVVDSVFHRSQIMRNKGTFENMATSFMAEPTKTYNLLRTEILTAKRELTEGKKKEATKRVSGILSVYLLANMTTAMAAAIADAMRGAGGDDEEDKGNFGQRWWAHSISNFKDSANPLNMIPFAKDVVSMYSGYSVERMDMQGISKLLKVQSMWEGLADGSSKYTYGHVIRTTAETMSYFTGVPVKNILRDAEGITKTVAEAFGAGTAVKYQVAKLTYTLSEDSKNRATFADLYYDALAEGDRALANEILRYMRSKGVTEKYIKNRKKTWDEHNGK